MAFATDDFERASLGSNWENGRGAYNNMQINNSSELSAATSSVAANACTWTANDFAPNQYSQGVIGPNVVLSTGSFYQIHVRMQPTTSECYLAIAQAQTDNTTDLWLEHNDGSNGFTQLGSKFQLGADVTTGDTLRIEVEGGSGAVKLRLIYNGILRVSHTDSTFNLTSGDPAIGVSGSQHEVIDWESWEGGELRPPLLVPNAFEGV